MSHTIGFRTERAKCAGEVVLLGLQLGIPPATRCDVITRERVVTIIYYKRARRVLGGAQ